MNILYCNWNENSAEDIKSVFNRLGYCYTEIEHVVSDFDNDIELKKKLSNQLQNNVYDMIYTFNYFPVVSKIAQSYSIPYVSWIYDCPHLTLYSHTISNDCNYIFLFDKEMYNTICSLGARHAYHLPLAVDTHRLNSNLGLSDSNYDPYFKYDVSFVGSLYERNMYDMIKYLPDKLCGYYEGLMKSQQQVWGYSFLPELFTDEIMKETEEYVKIGVDDRYSYSFKTIFESIVDKKITSTERIHLLDELAAHCNVDVFTGSDSNILHNVQMHGGVSYIEEMSEVFNQSKININISLRSIRSGIPLRCLDVMGAHGFLISNYQPELAEYFIPDEEVVLFESESDLIDKVSYYLTHDEERIHIAHNGWSKVQKLFSYDLKVQEMMQVVDSCESLSFAK